MNVYKNDLDETVRFRIEPPIGTEGVYLELQENGKRATTVFPPKDAPALALAILEAANYDMGSEVSLAVEYLERHTKAVAQEESEAEAQSELEAEALELYKAHTGYTHAKSLSETAAPDRWLAVARRARYCMSRGYELARGGKLSIPSGGADAVYTADSTRDGLYDVILRENGERWGTAWLEEAKEPTDD